MRAEVISCDVCGVQKKQTNHWFEVELGNDLWADLCDCGKPTLLLHELHEDTEDLDSGAVHVCGSSCAQKVLERFLAGLPLVERRIENGNATES
jgi:hypothetical protein